MSVNQLTREDGRQVVKKKGRVVVVGIEHGLSGYTNYQCRCPICTEANKQHSRNYRALRFAGQPMCSLPNCQRKMSRAYGNGLCYRHAEATKMLREVLADKTRKQLKSYIYREELEIRVVKSMTDGQIRDAIINEIITKYPSSLRSYVEEDY